MEFNREREYCIVTRESYWCEEEGAVKQRRVRVSVTREQFHDYCRELYTFQKEQRQRGSCRGPYRLACDTDCLVCPYYKAGGDRSLDEVSEDGRGRAVCWADALLDDGPPLDFLMEEQELLSRLFEALRTIDPMRRAVCELWARGVSAESIAEKLGITDERAVRRQYRQAIAELRVLLKDFLE